MDHSNSIDSKFRVAIIVAKRAKQLINGAKQLVDIEAQNPLTIAIEEVRQGLVTAEILDSVNIYLQEATLLGEESGEVQIVDETDMDLPLENEETRIELVKKKITEPEEVKDDEEKPSEDQK